MKTPTTLGEHLFQARLSRGLTQIEVANMLGACATTVLHWEKGQTEPRIGDIPAILQFLGYDSFPAPTTLCEHLLAIRQKNGWSITFAAKRIQLDPATWAGWEKGKPVFNRRHQRILESLLYGSHDLVRR